MNPTNRMVKMDFLPNPKAMITSFTSPNTIGFSHNRTGFLIFLLLFVIVQIHTIVNSISMIPSKNEFEINMEDMKNEESVASSFQKRDLHYHGSIIESKEQQMKMNDGTSHNDNIDIVNVKPSHSDAKELKIDLRSRSKPRFMFGHSTGHSGSTALHYGER